MNTTRHHAMDEWVLVLMVATGLEQNEAEAVVGELSPRLLDVPLAPPVLDKCGKSQFASSALRANESQALLMLLTSDLFNA